LGAVELLDRVGSSLGLHVDQRGRAKILTMHVFVEGRCDQSATLREKFLQIRDCNSGGVNVADLEFALLKSALWHYQGSSLLYKLLLRGVLHSGLTSPSLRLLLLLSLGLNLLLLLRVVLNTFTLQFLLQKLAPLVCNSLL